MSPGMKYNLKFSTKFYESEVIKKHISHFLTFLDFLLYINATEYILTWDLLNNCPILKLFNKEFTIEREFLKTAFTDISLKIAKMKLTSK